MSGKTNQKSSEYPLAHLYQRFVLDPVIEVARSIAHDFVMRPRHYRNIPEEIAEILQGFRIRTGTDPAWLSAGQRLALFSSIFDDTFSSTSIGLRTASVAFVDRGVQESADLTQQGREEAAAFRTYLKAIEGRVISMAEIETRAVFQSAIKILRNEAVAGVFGLSAAPDGNWPFEGPDTDSSNGGELIAEIQRALGLTSIRPTVTPHRFLNLQRIAYHGAGTIAGALNETGLDNPNDLQELIRNSYAWEKSLQALLSDVDMVRAWKDPQYRQELSPIEKATMDPHPSGEGGLKGTPLDLVTAERRGLGVGGFSTWTIVAICCSTGALSCTQATEYKVCRTSDIECGILAIK